MNIHPKHLSTGKKPAKHSEHALVEVVLPLPCEYLAFKNIRHTLKVISRLKRKYKMHFGLQGILLTMADNSSKFAACIEDSARRDPGKWMFKACVPVSGNPKDSPFCESAQVAKAVAAAAWKSNIDLAREITA
jgi:cellulose biosynthesis protein BcsQ